MQDSAAHRQTKYVAAPPLDEPVALPMPEPTEDIAQAQADLTETGMCILLNAIAEPDLIELREKLEEQAEAERKLGDKAPPGTLGAKQGVPNLVNKGQCFLDLVTRPECDALAGYMLGKTFLLSSLTGSLFHGPTTEPQQLHRDQGQVPATADFVASCNLFFLLDDFTPEDGSTCIIPGSHRWPAEYQVQAPSRDMVQQIKAPAGSIFSWDGRLWHGTGVNHTGARRASITTYFCLPWLRQQENWGVTCLQEVLDEADPKLKARLGLRTYGTLGMMSGTRVESEAASLGNYDVEIPEYVIGEKGALHKVQRVSKSA